MANGDILGTIISALLARPAAPSTPSTTPPPAEQVIGLIVSALLGKPAPSPAGAAKPAVVLSPIDSLLGGEALTGKKTALSIAAYSILSIVEASVGIPPGVSSILTSLIGGFGGLGLVAKVDRAIQALSTVAEKTGSAPADAAAAELTKILTEVASGNIELPKIPDIATPSGTTLPGPSSATQSFTLLGTMSTFGGPKDKGMQPDEGLAILGDGDLVAFKDYFLPQQPPDTTGLGRRLNPEASYIACRWEYGTTSKSYLKTIKVLVVNPKNGKQEAAQPVDWGPNIKTGRVADLSPGLADRLGLKTDDDCRVVIPLPASAAVQAPAIISGSHLHVMPTESLVRANFGDFSYQDTTGGRIAIDQSWISSNIVTVSIPQLAHLRHPTVECHKAIAKPLQEGFAEVERRGLLDRVLIWDGLWVPRHMSWNINRPLSRHSWGIAFDINASFNGYGNEAAPKGAQGSVEELVPIFESVGFAWGGFFRPDSIRDGMHFEYCQPVK